MASKYYNHGKFRIDIYDTGDESSWIFEVRLNGKVIGEGHNFTDREKAISEAENFTKYYCA